MIFIVSDPQALPVITCNTSIVIAGTSPTVFGIYLTLASFKHSR